jgi:hypothetical protein
VPKRYRLSDCLERAMDTLSPMATVLLSETLAGIRARKTSQGCRLCFAMRVKHLQGACPFAGPGAYERLFSSAFSPLIGPGQHKLVVRSVDLSAPDASALLSNSLFLGADATPQTPSADLHARLKCIGLAAAIMADEDLLSSDMIVQLAESVRRAPGWVRMDDYTFQCYLQTDEAGRYVYAEKTLLEMALRARPLASTNPTAGVSPLFSATQFANPYAPSEATALGPYRGTSFGPVPAVLTLRHGPSVPLTPALVPQGNAPDPTFGAPRPGALQLAARSGARKGGGGKSGSFGQ